MKDNKDNIPLEDVVDDTNTIEGQLISKSAPRISRHLVLQLKKYLSDVPYPAAKSTLYNTAKDQGANANVLSVISGLQRNSYGSFEELHHEITPA